MKMTPYNSETDHLKKNIIKSRKTSKCTKQLIHISFVTKSDQDRT